MAERRRHRGPSVPKPPWEWVDSQSRFDELVGQWADCERIAFDTEFHRERTYYPQLSLVQVGWPDGLVLVDPFAVDFARFDAVLESDCELVMHAGEQDLEILLHVCGLLPRRVFDTQIAAGFMGMKSPSLASLSKQLVGVEIPKGDQLADWTRRPLGRAQCAYAATDVEHLLEIWQRQTSELAELGRLQWALDEIDSFLAKDRGPRPAESAWWRLKGSRRLRGSSRGVAQAVAEWRELRARDLDRPPRHIMSDLSILALAGRPPRNEGQLKGVRGLDSRFRRSEDTAELLSIIDSGQQMPKEELCLPPVEGPNASVKAASGLAVAWINQVANDLKLDPALLATRDDVNAHLQGRESQLSVGWRHEVAGKDVDRIRSGEVALTCGEGDQLIMVPNPTVTTG